MTAKQAEKFFKYMGGRLFDNQWREARAFGLSEERIAELWALRSIQPPPGWQPPPLEAEKSE